MKPQDLYFELPEELIAEKPPIHRTESRLLVVDRKKKNLIETKFDRIIEFLDENTLLVFNNTKVFKARMYGKTENGREIEILLVERIDDRKWKTMVKNSRKFKSGTIVNFSGFEAKILEKIEEFRLLEFKENLTFEQINQIGQIPLPPYIIYRRKKLGLPLYTKEDEERYQSIFAKKNGSVAAPTASFHFSEKLIEELRSKGVSFAFVTLHVGPGTFKPIEGEIENYQIHREWIEIDNENIELIKKSKMSGKRIVAVGTTTVRTLETLSMIYGEITNFKPYAGYTDLFIKEDFKFKVVDSLITNFHLPYSTLLLLVYAFAGKELIKQAYSYAIENKFRFYSYGDAMFII